MDPSDAINIIVLFILILLSGFFSSAETTIISVNKIKIRSMVEENVKNAALVAELTDNSRKFISTVLIGNNIVNISASALATTFVARVFGNIYIGIGTGVLTLLILVFGEVLPKTIASMHSESIALAYAPILLLLMKVFTPLVFLLNIISGAILKLFGIDPDMNTSAITENELLTYVEVSHEEGIIENEEKEMITNVVDFGDSLVKDVMVPRVDMCLISDDTGYDELLSAFEEDKYSRLPVYQENVDNIVGIVYLKDVAFYKGDKKDFKLASILRPANFTYEFKKTSELLIEMRKASLSMCVVLDEYGSAVGLITLEDLLEEIVGEIRDEYDGDEVDDIVKLDQDEFMVLGSTRLEDFNDFFGTEYNSDDYDSIAGKLIELFERLPEKGDAITDGSLSFLIECVDHRRIEKIKVRRLPTADDTSDYAEADFGEASE